MTKFVGKETLVPSFSSFVVIPYSSYREHARQQE
jgi:hypothetical protein